MNAQRLQEWLAMSNGFLQAEGAGLMAFDTDCRYVFWNSVMERISGLSASEAVGRPASEIFPFIETTGENGFFKKALAGESVVSKNQRYAVPESAREGSFDA